MVAYGRNAAEFAIAGGAQHALAGEAAHQTRHRGVRKRRPLVIRSAQGMPAHGLHHGMAIHACGESRADSDDDGRHIHGSAQVALGQHGIDHRVGRHVLDACAHGVHQNRDDAFAGKQIQGMGRITGTHGRHAFHLGFPHTNGFAEGNGATDRQRLPYLGHKHGSAASHKAQRDGAGDIAGAADHRKHRRSSLQRLPATTGVSHSAAMRRAACQSATVSTLLIKTTS